MDLNEYLSAERGRQAALCKAINAHAPDVSRWAARTRPVPIERCAPIEHATGGAVKRWNLRPDDWFIHWPELKGAEGAPDVPRPESEVSASEAA